MSRLFGRERVAIEGVYQGSAQSIASKMRLAIVLLQEQGGSYGDRYAAWLESAALMLERGSLAEAVAVSTEGILYGITQDAGFITLSDDLQQRINDLRVDLAEYRDGLRKDGVSYGGMDQDKAARKVAHKYRQLFKDGKRSVGVTRADSVVTIILSEGPAELTKKELKLVRKPSLWGQRRGVETRITVAKSEKVEPSAGSLDLVFLTGSWIHGHGISL